MTNPPVHDTGCCLHLTIRLHTYTLIDTLTDALTDALTDTLTDALADALTDALTDTHIQACPHKHTHTHTLLHLPVIANDQDLAGVNEARCQSAAMHGGEG